MTPKPYSVKLRSVFQLCDADGDKDISKAELLHALRNQEDVRKFMMGGVGGHAADAYEKQMEKIFARIDVNGSAVIDWPEFAGFFLDPDAAGDVTKERCDSRLVRVVHFFTQLAPTFPLLYEDVWQAARLRAAGLHRIIIDRLASVEGGCLAGGKHWGRPIQVLDTAFGMGINSIALPSFVGSAGPDHARGFEGYRVRGLSFSKACLEQTEEVLQAQGVEPGLVECEQGSFFHLHHQKPHDIVLCLDNAIALCLDIDMLTLALTQLSTKVRPGGLLLVALKDYDAVLGEGGEPAQGVALDQRQLDGRFPSSYLRGDERVVHVQNWAWDELDPARRLYTLEHYLLRGTRDLNLLPGQPEGWNFKTTKTAVAQRALTRQELAAEMHSAGFGAIRWLSPAQTGYNQHVCVGVKPLDPRTLPTARRYGYEE